MSDYKIITLTKGDDSLELTPGLNMVSEKWRNFMLRMLYGKASGGMELIRNGRKISVSCSGDSFSAVYSDSGEAVEGLCRENLGETLTGLKSDEFYQRLCENREISTLPEKRSFAEDECVRLENEMMQSRKTERLSALSEMRIKRTMRDRAESEYLSAVRHREECQTALKACRIGGSDPDEVRAEIRADVEKSLALKKLSDKKPNNTVQVIVLLLGIALAVLSVLYMPEKILKYALPAAALLCFVSVVLFIRSAKLRKLADKAEEDRLSILKKYGTDSEADMVSLGREFMASFEAFREAKSLEKRAALELEKMNRLLTEQSETSITKLDFSSGSSEAVMIAKRLNGAKILRSDISSRINKLKNDTSCLMMPLDNSQIKLYHEESMFRALLNEIACNRQIIAFPGDE